MIVSSPIVLLFLLLISFSISIKALKLEISTLSDCSTCHQNTVDLEVKTELIDSNTTTTKHAGFGDTVMVDCCNNVNTIVVFWYQILSNTTTTDTATTTTPTCCFGMKFHKGEVKFTTMLNDLFKDLWFCSARGYVDISINNNPDKLRINRLWAEVFNHTYRCSESNMVYLNFVPAVHEERTDTISYRCSKISTDDDIRRNSQLPLCSSIDDLSPTSSSTPTQRASTVVPSGLPSSPNRRYCSEDGQWPDTPINTNHTLPGGCHNGTVTATRRCGNVGVWDSTYCLVEEWFNEIVDQLNTSPERALDTLTGIVNEPYTVRNGSQLVQVVYLLDRVLQAQIDGSNGDNLTNGFTNSFMETSVYLIDVVQDTSIETDTRRSIGSQLLISLDNLALNVAAISNETININDTLYLNVAQYQNLSSYDEGNGDVLAIQVDSNSISLPSGLVYEPQAVRVGSYFFTNLSHLLPPMDSGTSIVSSVISSSVSCQPYCPSITQLDNNVTIELYVKDLSKLSGSVSCVFYDIEIQQDGPPNGSWSSDGCHTIINYTDSTVTCSCNHLTSFAILLSGSEVSEPPFNKVLGIIEQTLVSVSIFCMVIIILTYTLIRSLWSLRSYVHVMVCVSLSMAQLVFLFGLDRTENKKVCSGVAVVLQYLFLVSFMWMLMEGVVLYIVLVKVLVKRPKCYAVGFTIACYFVPAVYMSAMIPLGFLYEVDDLPGGTHYLYYINYQLAGCWLNYDTGFIWSFIAPVITIIFINMGFFVMAIVVMRRHLRKQDYKESVKKATFRKWLQVSISLTVVMGLTWLVGIIVNIKELVFMVYLTTAFIGGQGILLFIILVPLSRQVREAYSKVCKRLYHSLTRSSMAALSRNSSSSSATNVIPSKTSNSSPTTVAEC